jgi:hypothetical protein
MSTDDDDGQHVIVKACYGELKTQAVIAVELLQLAMSLQSIGH